MTTLNRWAAKQLMQFGHTIDESSLKQAFSSATHAADFKIQGLTYDDTTKTLTLAAFGKFAGEKDEYAVRFQYLTPTLPRVKDLSELLGAKIIKICNYAQFTAKDRHRAVLGCYATVVTSDGKKFNLSTSEESKMSDLLDARKVLRLKDYSASQSNKYLEVK